MNEECMYVCAEICDNPGKSSGASNPKKLVIQGVQYKWYKFWVLFTIKCVYTLTMKYIFPTAWAHGFKAKIGFEKYAPNPKILPNKPSFYSGSCNEWHAKKVLKTEQPWNTLKRALNFCKNTLTFSWNFLETSMKDIWNFYERSLTLRWKILETLLKLTLKLPLKLA